MKSNKGVRFCILLLISSIFTGCGLLPPKEEPRMAPVLKSYEPEDYNIVYVEKGKVSLEKNISCTYTQLKEENLSFTLTGNTIERMFCSAGDIVKKGDLLAQLELGGLDTEMKDLDFNIGKQKILLAQKSEMLELELDRLQILSHGLSMSKEESEKGMNSLRMQYEASIQTIKDTLYIDELKKEELSNRMDSYMLYAGMNGTISYIKKDIEGSQSKKNEEIITIIDSTMASFQANTEYSSAFSEKEEVTVTTKTNSYQTIAYRSEEEDIIYFQLKTPEVDLEIGDKGNVQLVLEEQEDTLYLPQAAVQKMQDSYYVYYIDDTGVQNIKSVEVGLENDSMIEIISGLEYGEAVIKK